MMKIFQDRMKTIKFEFYGLDEIEITVDDDIVSTYINLSAKQAKSLHEWLDFKYRK